MPVLFVGHGHPVNALLDTDFSRALTAIGHDLEKPEAILVISAHWETVGTFVSSIDRPRTIHDFGPFSDELYQLTYPAPGAPEMARQLQEQVSLTLVGEDPSMGLDHGAWTVLQHLRPQADIPVFEMSIDYTRNASYHFRLGAELAQLREKGVLVICSGNIVHNLSLSDWKNIDATPADWNLEFDELVKENVNRFNFKKLINYQEMGPAAGLSIPTNDHYLPLLYSLGMAGKNEPVTHFYEGYQFGGISMRCFRIG